MNKLFALLLVTLFIVSPSMAQTKKEVKQAKKQQEYEAIKKLINSKQFEFIGEWATSNTGKRINLMSNPTYLKIDNSSADAFFPFFGRGFAGSGYGSDGGIEFTDPLENYNVEFDENKQTIDINFTGKGKNDTYKVIIKVFSSSSASVNINSNNRSNMSYSGKIKALDKKE